MNACQITLTVQSSTSNARFFRRAALLSCHCSRCGSRGNRSRCASGSWICSRKCSAAFSLIEVLCAVLILGIGIAGLIQGTTMALRSSRETEQQTAAALLAAGRIETLRADGFVIEGESEGDGEEDLAKYHWRQSISRTGTDGLYEVQVEVQDSRSRISIYELRTLLFDPSTLSPDAGPGTSPPDRKSRGKKK